MLGEKLVVIAMTVQGFIGFGYCCSWSAGWRGNPGIFFVSFLERVTTFAFRTIFTIPVSNSCFVSPVFKAECFVCYSLWGPNIVPRRFLAHQSSP